MKYYSVAFTSRVHEALCSHLLQTRSQEDLCFALWRPSTGASRQSALLYKSISPEIGDRELHGNASFYPQYFERALREAAREGAGLAFLHSHVGPGWQGMSEDDINAEEGHAGATFGASGLPLVGLTLGTDGAWSARFWPKTAPRTFERRWCSSVRAVGERLSVTYMDELEPIPRIKTELTRTVSAWGPSAQARFARLHIGVVGVGSVGCLIAEALARMGAQKISLIDFDLVELVNLDRLLHARHADAVARRLKVAMIAAALRNSATADTFRVHEVPFSVTEDEGYRAALDCDLLFSCVDRPWGRSVLNHIAYAHLIPVVDGGISVSVTKRSELRGADWKAHTAAPGRRCLECLGQYDPGLVSVEKLGLLEDPNYIQGLPRDHEGRRNENVFAFSMGCAYMELQQMLSMVLVPAGLSNVGQQTYHFATGRFDEPLYEKCLPSCYQTGQIAIGDHSGVTVTGKHPAAEKCRAKFAANDAQTEI
jgi:hypothetical protein